MPELIPRSLVLFLLFMSSRQFNFTKQRRANTNMVSPLKTKQFWRPWNRKPMCQISLMQPWQLDFRAFPEDSPKPSDMPLCVLAEGVGEDFQLHVPLSACAILQSLLLLSLYCGPALLHDTIIGAIDIKKEEEASSLLHLSMCQIP